MILGIFDKAKSSTELEGELCGVTRAVSAGDAVIWAADNIAVSCLPDRKGDPVKGHTVVSEDGMLAVTFQGRVYNADAAAPSVRAEKPIDRAKFGEQLMHLYRQDRQNFLEDVNGQFAFVIWDGQKRELLLGRDRLGIEDLFYAVYGDRIVFASSLRALLQSRLVMRATNPQAIVRYLLFCYNPSDDTLIQNVHRVPAAHVLSWNGGPVRSKRYWRLSFAQADMRGEAEIHEELLELIRDSIRLRLQGDGVPGVLLSGGTDSSAIVSIASTMLPDSLRTFSFRCAQGSYDESQYARFVARHYGTEHTEIPYGSADLPLISQAVEWMDEPFCDVGIEIGTYVLGRGAEGRASYVLSGEGGDELFAGHPVYVADKFTGLPDRMPDGLVKPVARLLQRIPDSHHKQNFQVKLKRFAYGLLFPSSLMSHRWRVYYTAQELSKLCTADFLADCDLPGMFDSVLEYNKEADGPDKLSRSLHSDFKTLVSFYLRRVGLLRAFGVESRLPLLDHRLVEYSARIPSRLKLHGLSETKYIYKKALERVLPRKILYDRPKLGHSVPLKNWLRQDDAVKEWLRDVFAGATFRERGIFRVDRVERLLDEHLSKAHNHSHRLWALVVLESWLQANLDT